MSALLDVLDRELVEIDPEARCHLCGMTTSVGYRADDGVTCEACAYMRPAHAISTQSAEWPPIAVVNIGETRMGIIDGTPMGPCTWLALNPGVVTIGKASGHSGSIDAILGRWSL